MEIWKPVKFWEDRYEVSNFGSVRNIKSKRILKWGKDTHGYAKICLFKPSDKKYVQIHRLVAISFIANINNYPMVNHIDGNKLNNRVENLEWVTQSLNQLHAVKIGLRKMPTGKNHPKYKGDIQVFKNGELIDVIKGSLDLVKKGYNHANVVGVINGKFKQCNGLVFKRL